MNRRTIDNLTPIMALIAPFLFAILAWFLAPVIRIVPEIDKKIDLQAQRLDEVSKKQEEAKTIQAAQTLKIEALKDKVEDVEDQVKDVERSLPRSK